MLIFHLILLVIQEHGKTKPSDSISTVTNDVDSSETVKSDATTTISHDVSSTSFTSTRMVYFELPVKAMAWWSVFQQQLIDYNNANKETSSLLNDEKTLLYIDLTSRISYLVKRIPKAVLMVHLVTPDTVRFFLNAAFKLREPRCIKRAVNSWSSARYDMPVDALTSDELSDRLWDQRLTLAKAVDKIAKLFDDYARNPKGETDNYKLSSRSMTLASMAISVSFADVLRLSMCPVPRQNEAEMEFISAEENTCQECQLATDPLFIATKGAACGACFRRQAVHDIDRLIPDDFDGITEDMNPHAMLQLIPLPLWIEKIEAAVNTKHSSKQTTKCIECCSLLFFDKNAYGNVICPDCRVFFCVACERKPHWPFSCDDAVECEKGVKGMTMSESLSEICRDARYMREIHNYHRFINRKLSVLLAMEDEKREMFDIIKTALYLSQQVLAYSFYQRFAFSSFKTIKQTATEVIGIVNRLPEMDTIDQFYRAKKSLQRSIKILMSFCR